MEQAMNPSQISASNLIESLGLEPHGEGGYYRRTHQADHRDMLETTSGSRFLMTSIYYLLTEDSPVASFISTIRTSCIISIWAMPLSTA